MAKRSRYYVSPHQGRWIVRYEDRNYGPYATQREAIRVAVNHAHPRHAHGDDAQVLVQGEDRSVPNGMDLRP